MIEVLDSKIAIVVTVQNKKLFQKTKNSIPSNIDLYSIDGRHGFFALNALELVFKSSQTKKYDWIIMADEDVIFIDFSAVVTLLKYMKGNNYQVSGMNDGNGIEFRKGSPKIPNLFFCIFNFNELNSKFSSQQFDYFRSVYEVNPEESINKKIEPYYVFFYYLLSLDFRILFLTAKNNFMSDDYESTILYNHLENKMIIHTWYARLYSKNKRHTQRIDNAIFRFIFFKSTRHHSQLKSSKILIFRFNYYLKKMKYRISSWNSLI